MKITQLCLILYDPMGYTVHGILQARILERVYFPFFRGLSQPRDQTQVSHTAGGFFTSWATRKAQEYCTGSLSLFQRIFLTQELNREKNISLIALTWSRSVVSNSLWPHGHQAPPSMGFSRQEYWSELPFPSPGNFPTQGLNPGLPHCRQTLYPLSHQW